MGIAESEIGPFRQKRTSSESLNLWVLSMDRQLGVNCVTKLCIPDNYSCTLGFAYLGKVYRREAKRRPVEL